jgi:hypothetical protein
MDQLRIKVGQIQLGHIVNQYFTILPETSDSISLNNFIASITQEHHLYLYGSTSTNIVYLEMVFYKSSIIGIL